MHQSQQFCGFRTSLTKVYTFVSSFWLLWAYPAEEWLSLPGGETTTHKELLLHWGEGEFKLFLFLQLPSKPSSQSMRVGNWSERKSHRLPRLPKRHSHDDMLLLAQLGIPSSPSSLNEDSLSTTSELLSTRRARRIPKVLAGDQAYQPVQKSLQISIQPLAVTESSFCILNGNLDWNRNSNSQEPRHSC